MSHILSKKDKKPKNLNGNAQRRKAAKVAAGKRT
jgi:hypothetical protein